MGLYTPTCSARVTPAPEIFVPQQYEREHSILSTDSHFDPNDHFHDPLLDPRYLAFILCSVYQRVRNPEPNFPSCIVIPVERLIYLAWYEYPEPTIHLEDYTIHCNVHEVYVQATPFHIDHCSCILSFSPTVADLFPSGQGDIFSMFFLKEDICYPRLRSVGLRVARNKSHFRQAWLRGEIDFGRGFPGKFFRSLSFIQQKFAKFVIDISDYVINPAAGKVAVCNRAALAAYLALGVDEHGDWVLSQDFWQYFTDTHGPCQDHVQLRTLIQLLRSHRRSVAQLRSSAHHSGPRHAHTLPLSAALCIRLNPVVTTLPRLPCRTVSSPCPIYTFYLVVFSPDLTYFRRT